MEKKHYTKYCIVPKCKNTSASAPDKKFLTVPKDNKVREKWCEVIGRDKQAYSSKSYITICEDHFDLPNDTENYIEHNIMQAQGQKVKLRLKKGVIPHIFDWSTDGKQRDSIDHADSHRMPEYQYPQPQDLCECQVQISSDSLIVEDSITDPYQFIISIKRLDINDIDGETNAEASSVSAANAEASSIGATNAEASSIGAGNAEASINGAANAEASSHGAMNSEASSNDEANPEASNNDAANAEASSIDAAKAEASSNLDLPPEAGVQKNANTIHFDQGNLESLDQGFDVSKAEDIQLCQGFEDTCEPLSQTQKEFSCTVCKEPITGFRYACVQCSDWDLCGACEARGEHATHYVLRIPPEKTLSETQVVLASLRQMLSSVSMCEEPKLTKIKKEVENEDPLAAAVTPSERPLTEEDVDDTEQMEEYLELDSPCTEDTNMDHTYYVLPFPKKRKKRQHAGIQTVSMKKRKQITDDTPENSRTIAEASRIKGSLIERDKVLCLNTVHKRGETKS